MARGQIILLVQDEPTDALLIERAIRKLNWPHTVKHVSDGEEAVAYLSSLSGDSPARSENLPALVLLDLKMPRSSGLEVLGWARSRPAFAQAPIVILTGSTNDKEREQALRAGADGFIVMPVAFDEIVRELAKLGKFL